MDSQGSTGNTPGQLKNRIYPATSGDVGLLDEIGDMKDASEQAPTQTPPPTPSQVAATGYTPLPAQPSQPLQPRKSLKVSQPLKALQTIQVNRLLRDTPPLRFLRRATSFGLVGGFVALTGIVLEFALVQYLHLDKHIAYLIQSIVSIELNFFINYFFTWHDRRGRGVSGIAKGWTKFHLVRVFTVTLNQLLYAALLLLGIQYLVANVLCILIILIINFWSGDKFIFSSARTATPLLPDETQLEASLLPRAVGKWLPRKATTTAWPSVSVIIPVKRSERTIEATIASLLQQDYPGPVEILLVGDKDDSTWQPIRSYIDSGALTIIEAEVFNARQDMNAKRNIGLRQARGQVIALVDSDLILPANWIADGVATIQRGWPCVVGSVKNLHDNLLATYEETAAYYERNRGRNTGRSRAAVEERVADVERVGVQEYKLPITANVFLSRDVLYYIQFPDPDFDDGYEDYQWHWELAQADVAVLSAPAIRATQRRRITFRQELGGHLAAGRGCARFMAKYPRTPFAHRQALRLAGTILSTGAIAGIVVAGVIYPHWPATLGITYSPLHTLPLGRLLIALLALAGIAVLLGKGIVDAWRIQQPRGVLFPSISLVLGGAFSAGLALGLTHGLLDTLTRIKWPLRRRSEQGEQAEPLQRVRFAIVNTVRQSISTPNGLSPERVWSMAGPQVTASLPPLARESQAPAWPSVSIVIPVKRSQATIRAAVESLLDQDYPGPVEILLVGDVNDPTWEPIQEHIASGRVAILETTIRSANRDANAKRTIGLHMAKGEILALTDSDMVLPHDWVSTGINYILKGWPCVAGPMRGARGDFWDSYADLVDLGSKTPRFGANVIVDKARFGQPYHKPPITANVFFIREVLAKSGDFDPSFTHSYEDYSWFWSVCRAGLPIFCTPALIADHYHRQGWRQLIRQYTRAGRGCGDFVLKYPDSPLSQGRLIQLAGVWAMLSATLGMVLTGLAGAIWPSLLSNSPLGRLAALLPGRPLPGLLLIAAVALLGALGLLGLGARNALTVRRPVAVIYPFITLVFAISFSVGLTQILSGAAKRWVLAHRAAIATGATLSGILSLGLGLRIWDVAAKPGTEWDEPVYDNVAWNLLHQGFPMLKPEVGHTPAPYFSQPPFYLWLLALWYWITRATSGNMITSARQLSALASVAMLLFIFLLLRRRQGVWALLPTLLVAVDGWIVFANRIAWIDNTAIPLGIAGLWAYDRALQQEQKRPFIIAGLLLASAALFKYLAIYFCAAVIINWLITRQRTRGSMFLVATVLLTVFVYLIAGVLWGFTFTHTHGNPFVAQHVHQVLRSTNKVTSRGNIITFQQILAALIAEYRIFTLTVGLCVISGALLIVDMGRCVWRKSLQPLRRHSLEASWALAAFIVFGIVQIKFINYFAYVIIPLLVYLSVRVVDVVKPLIARTATRQTLRATMVRAGLVALLLAAVSLNLNSFSQRIVSRNDNTFVSVQKYAAVHIPPRDQVLTEQPIGTMIQQPYCQLINISNCLHPRWIILFTSLTERPPDDPQLHYLLAHSKLRATYKGFKETVYIYQIQLPHVKALTHDLLPSGARLSMMEKERR